MALGVAELQLIENAKYSFAKLCQLNGFDPVIFSTEGSTFANKQEAVKELILKVIKPKVDNFYKNLSIFLGSGYNGDQIVPDWSKVEELQDDRKLLTDLLTRQIETSIITPYKAAKTLYGDEADENPAPDFYFRKTSLVPTETEIPEAPDPNAIPGPLPDPNIVNADMIQQMIDENNGN
jgi:phage portal protein BeeE